MKRLKGDGFQIIGLIITSTQFGVWQDSWAAGLFIFGVFTVIFYTLTESKIE